MVYEFSYAERDQYADIYEKILRSREWFSEKHPEWDALFPNNPAEDEYDRLCNPMYIVAEDEAGGGIASVRVLPTTGKTMLRQEFARYFDGTPDIISPDVWELSRLSVTADTGSLVGRSLALDVLKTVYARAFSNGVSQLVAVYPKFKLRLYRRLDWMPASVSSGEREEQELCLGVWDVTPLALRRLIELQLRAF